MTDDRGFVNVFALRLATAKLERLQPVDDDDHCQSKECTKRHERQTQLFATEQAKFMQTWGRALLSAIARNDEVAEVIWRQCSVTPVILRSALASTCDPDPARQAEARRRLKAIGFEPAIENEPETWLPGQDRVKVDKATKDRVIAQMKSGVFGGPFSGVNNGGNAANTPDELHERRRAAAILGSSALVRRAFTYTSMRNSYGNDALRLNRAAIGAEGLAWGTNVLHSGSPYSGIFNPLRHPYDEVYLKYLKPVDVYQVGGPQDTVYLTLLLDILTSSEKSIDTWLKRDPRWSVFLMHRQGHHEWVPEATESPFGKIDPAWQGRWLLEKEFVNLKRSPNPPASQAQIDVQGHVSSIRFASPDKNFAACSLRYSGASSLIPENKTHVGSVLGSALGYLPELGRGIPLESDQTAEVFSPMNPAKTYRQVLVQCPQAEWPDNDNKHFLFLSGNTLIQVVRPEKKQDLTIRHWKRTTEMGLPLPAPYSQKPLLEKMATLLVTAQQHDTETAALRVRQAEVFKRVDQASTDELIASLEILRNERGSYSQSNFPPNLTKLVAAENVSMQVCEAYRKHPKDDLQRFNLVVIMALKLRAKNLTPEEIPIVTECLREALKDAHPWVIADALYGLVGIAKETDRPKLLLLQQNANEDVRMYAGNVLLGLDAKKKAGSNQTPVVKER